MQALRFEGSGMEYFKIWIINILLTILTLGLYHPWAKVRKQRYFYANSTFEDRNFEYHATGKQLFMGFIIGMVLFITFIVIQESSPVGSLIIVVVLFFSVPWLILRSMMFNMKMTSFSNVRFGFTGTSVGSYMSFLVYPFALICGFFLLGGGIMLSANYLSGVVAGIAILLLIIFFISLSLYGSSYIKKKQIEFLIDNTRYGQGEFKTHLETMKLVIIMLKMIGVQILAMLIIALVSIAILFATIGLDNLMELQSMFNNPMQMQEKMAGMIVAGGLIYLGLFISGLFVLAYYITRQRNYIFDNITLDGKISFASTLRVLPLGMMMTSNFLAIIFTLGLALPWAKVRLTRIMLENTLIDAGSEFDTYVTQKLEEESALGEQIGDAFDIDVGLNF
jgi:uncharacterized membrane protein YjgN (DUF898 family)